MPLTNFPNGASSFGIPLVGSGPILPGGSVFFVSSVTGGTGSGRGLSKDSPLSTIAGALALCSASRGDYIICLPGHTETVIGAAGIDLSVAGITVLGIGAGTLQPTINFTTSTAATFRISAANVTVDSLRFTCGIASQTTMIAVTAAAATVQNCTFVEGTQTGLSFMAITGVANAADRLTVQNNTFYNPTAGNMNHAIGLSEVEDRVIVRGNLIIGQFALSGIHNITGKVLTNLTIADNVVRNLTAAKQAMNLISACTGQSTNNRFLAGDLTVAAASFGTALLSERDNGNNGALSGGDTFIFAKTGLVSSTITTGGVAISGASSGALMAEAVTVQTGATGLAAATNFQITVDNVSGLPAPWVETVANLGANKTVTAGSVASTQFVVESGKTLTAKATVTNCTGAGTIDIYIRFKRLTAGANIVAV